MSSPDPPSPTASDESNPLPLSDSSDSVGFRASLLRRPGRASQDSGEAGGPDTNGMNKLSDMYPFLFEGIRQISLEDEDEAMEVAKALAIRVKEICHTFDKLRYT